MGRRSQALSRPPLRAAGGGDGIAAGARFYVRAPSEYRHRAATMAQRNGGAPCRRPDRATAALRGPALRAALGLRFTNKYFLFISELLLFTGNRSRRNATIACQHCRLQVQGQPQIGSGRCPFRSGPSIRGIGRTTAPPWRAEKDKEQRGCPAGGAVAHPR